MFLTRGNLTGLHYLAGNITVEIAITLFTAGAVEAVKGSLYSIKGIKYVVDLLEPVFKMINRFGNELIKPIAWMLRQGLEFGISSSRFIIKSGTDAILELYEEAGKYVVKAMRWIDAIEFDASLPRYELQLGEAWAMVTPEGNTVPFGNRVLQITRTRDGKFGVRVNNNFKNLSKLPENVLRKVDNAGWTDDLLKKLDDDLDNESLFKKFGEKPDLVEGWRKLLHSDISDVIRKNPTYLNAVSKQISNYGEKVAFKLERVLPHIKQDQLPRFFDALDNSKSIDHVRSLVGDFENIPGIKRSPYVPNSLPNIDIPAPGTWADPLLGMQGYTAQTFTSATAKTLSPGQKIYRVLSEGQSKAGGFWTYELPKNKTDLFGGTAVRPEWNSGTHYIEYTIPESGLKVWDGPTARQPVLPGIEEVHLPGGTVQIYIPDAYRQVGSNFEELPLHKIDLQ